jgi:hypothetical protein
VLDAPGTKALVVVVVACKMTVFEQPELFVAAAIDEAVPLAHVAAFSKCF